MANSEYLLWPARYLPTEGRINPWPRLEIFYPIRSKEGKCPMVVVLPGGGYARNAPHEGAPVARYFASRGFVAGVVHYRVAPDCFPAPYLDAARALRVMRQMSEQLNGDPQRVTVVGFSAGGHLAALLGTNPDLFRDEGDDLTREISARPDRMILAYPVVSFLTDPHLASIRHLIGEFPTIEERAAKSVELLITNQTPPTFIFHAISDPVVPYQHTLAFSAAMRRCHVPVAMHLAQAGGHGTSIHDEDGSVHSWVEEAIAWTQTDCSRREYDGDS